jgi:hypothetical protein
MNDTFALSVSGIDPIGDYADRLCRAGCSDTLVAIIGGKLYLDFDREGVSFDAAVRSAQQDVERAGGHVDYMLPPR